MSLTLIHPTAVNDERVARQRDAEQYLSERTGTYEYRTQRYSAVYNLIQTGLGRFKDESLIIDLGAGAGDFDYFLRHDKGYFGRYMPVDAALDGTDLETYDIQVKANVIVAIEVVEHLHQAERLMAQMMNNRTGIAVITTPNAGVQDVLALDRTHVREFRAEDLRALGWQVEVRSFFGKPDDSLLAWY